MGVFFFTNFKTFNCFSFEQISTHLVTTCHNLTRPAYCKAQSTTEKFPKVYTTYPPWLKKTAIASSISTNQSTAAEVNKILNPSPWKQHEWATGGVKKTLRLATILAEDILKHLQPYYDRCLPYHKKTCQNPYDKSPSHSIYCKCHIPNFLITQRLLHPHLEYKINSRI